VEKQSDTGVTGNSRRERQEIMAHGEVNIFDIMACNVYWDFKNSPMPKETHTFLVALFPTPGKVTPDLIDQITAYGPAATTCDSQIRPLIMTTKTGGSLIHEFPTTGI
jgi:hypothetical protein